MANRFAIFLIERLLPVAVLLAILALLLYAVVAGPRKTAASPSRTATEAQAASEWAGRAQAGSGDATRVYTEIPQIFDSLIHPAVEEARPAKPPAGVGVPSSTSAARLLHPFLDPRHPYNVERSGSLSVKSKSVRPAVVASPNVRRAAGLHPILESWKVGVASGIASNMGPSWPTTYLALPIGPGYVARICGPGGCVTRTSTDAGPSLAMQRPPYNRVADLSVADFEAVCGVPASFGLCQVSVTVVGR